MTGWDQLDMALFRADWCLGLRRVVAVLCLSLAASSIANDRPQVPDASLQSLAMDPLSVYQDYERLWSEAVEASAADIAGWKELVESLDADVIAEKCGYRMWTSKNDDSWQEEAYAPWEPSPWRLETVDGVQPDSKTRKAYAKDKEKAAKREAKERRRAARKGQTYSPPSRHPMGVGDLLREFPDPDVVMYGVSTRFLGFRADPMAEDPMRRATQVTVGINRAGHIESYDQRSWAPFAGGGGVTIEKFHLRVLFVQDEAVRLPVVRFQEIVMDAKVLRVLKARDNTVRWYADLSCRDW